MPGEWRPVDLDILGLIGRKVTVQLVDGSKSVGYVYTIDPESHSIALVQDLGRLDHTLEAVEILVGTSIVSVDEVEPSTYVVIDTDTQHPFPGTCGYLGKEDQPFTPGSRTAHSAIDPLGLSISPGARRKEQESADRAYDRAKVLLKKHGIPFTEEMDLDAPTVGHSSITAALPAVTPPAGPARATNVATLTSLSSSPSRDPAVSINLGGGHSDDDIINAPGNEARGQSQRDHDVIAHPQTESQGRGRFLRVLRCLTLRWPYTARDGCSCANEIVLTRIKTLLMQGEAIGD